VQILPLPTLLAGFDGSSEALARALGGPDGRTLFTCIDADFASGFVSGSGWIEQVRVDTLGSGFTQVFQ
jgi:hypothetical protein